MAQYIDFAELAALVDGLLAQADGRKGGRPAYPTEVMVRVLILKCLYEPSEEHTDSQLPDRMSYQRFCLLQDSMNVPDRKTIWRFAQRIEVDGAAALLQGVDSQLQRHGYIARGGQTIHAALVPAPRKHISKEDKERLAQGNDSDWTRAKRRQKDLDAAHTKKHGKSQPKRRWTSTTRAGTCTPTRPTLQSAADRRCSRCLDGAMACSAGQAKTTP